MNTTEPEPVLILPPEVRGALTLAVKSINRAADARFRHTNKYRVKKLKRKWQEKAQKHIARAERYAGLKESTHATP